ncbi:conserved hypothetical protein [Burkholderia pseudomallei 406e]|uniref:Uncharacterized protein n=1 Tax=Burkholderia pseudomallei 1710a TaxID=320371 RepID=A0A0E1W1L5_BURPE|nr:hypothetical protein BMASAVP1_A1656 [Burkholderia mallei SAVP1]AFR15833.1 hypothetical protein BPC006_I1963 [Burkholderia pseudomallei BPC006]EBA46542.1 hypothetical protein BURPS305_1283 [Burkholderia pseudomallei 305]EDO85037.1 conserved hypothetical protein [Burkholderia pseudomallei 406e]EDO92091.1 hypothetical protein BURPSPAST_AA0552 [Burkholderia pseudomallei Pasteur 52237]EDS87525.1 hypothetical protein BURPSS13_P0542 [Burkholderia pseudomallei S13]EEC35468.1 conserved hypothetical
MGIAEKAGTRSGFARGKGARPFLAVRLVEPRRLTGSEP